MELFTLVKLYDPSFASFSRQMYLMNEMLTFARDILGSSMLHYSIYRLNTTENSFYTLDQKVEATYAAHFQSPDGPFAKNFTLETVRVTPANGKGIVEQLEQQVQTHKMYFKQHSLQQEKCRISFHLPQISHTDHYYVLKSHDLQLHYQIFPEVEPFEESCKITLYTSTDLDKHEHKEVFKDTYNSLAFFRQKEFKVLSIDEDFRKDYNKQLGGIIPRLNPLFVFPPQILIPKKPKNTSLDLSQIGMYISHVKRALDKETLRLHDLGQQLEETERNIEEYEDRLSQAEGEEEIEELERSLLFHREEEVRLQTISIPIKQLRLMDQNKLLSARVVLKELLKKKD